MAHNMPIYGFEHYKDGRKLVSRAYLLVMASRFKIDLDWADAPLIDIYSARTYFAMLLMT
jgi:hypothetical protein